MSMSHVMYQSITLVLVCQSAHLRVIDQSLCLMVRFHCYIHVNHVQVHV